MCDKFIYEEFSHELINSVSSLKTIHSIIEDKITERKYDEINEYLIISKEIFNHIEIVNREFYTLCNTPNVKKATFYINDIIDKILIELSPMAKTAHINIVRKYKNNKVYSDPIQLKILLSILINNAIKYNVDKGTLLIETYTVKNGLKIVLYDSGIGMTQEELKNIGTPFYRCKRIEKDGTGLGICIAKKICKLLNMQFDIQSNINNGTRICLFMQNNLLN